MQTVEIFKSQTSDYINCDSIGDGAYLIKLYYNNNEMIKSYGYYVGGAMFDEISIVFTANDSLIIKEISAF